MLLGLIGGISAVLSVILCALLGGFTGLTWLWLVPVLFLSAVAVLLGLGFVFLWWMAQRVDQNVEQEQDDPFYRKMLELYLAALMKLVRLHMEVSGLEKIPESGRFVLVCNHLHMADPAILLHFFRGKQVAFISKKEVADMFIVGNVMHKILCQPLDRENDRKALRTILKCIQIIKEDKASIGVFPEGYTSVDGKFHEFRSGVFKIPMKANVPIVVCTLQGTQDLFDNMKHWKPTYAKLHVLGVIEEKALWGRTAVDIGNEVHAMMAADLGEN